MKKEGQLNQDPGIHAGGLGAVITSLRFLLGLFASKEIVGICGAGEKIVRTMEELGEPIQQARRVEYD